MEPAHPFASHKTSPVSTTGDLHDLSEQLGPPPPYESVVLASVDLGNRGAAAPAVGTPPRAPGAGAGPPVPSSPPPPAQPEQDIDILISDPVRQGEGVGAYISYKVTTRTSLARFARPRFDVIRRFSDFDWLHQRLCEKFRGVIVPPVPEKSAVQKLQMSEGFLEARRKALQVFINRVAQHPDLGASDDLKRFLEAPEDEWAGEVAVARADEPARRLTGLFDTVKSMADKADRYLSGRAETDNVRDDREYLAFKEYLGILEGHLGEMHRQAERVVRKSGKLAASLSDLSTAGTALGQFEQEPVRAALGAVNQGSSQSAHLMELHTGAAADRFEAPLKELTRTMRSVRGVMADRSAALTAMAAAREEKEIKRLRLVRIRSTPGSRPDKVAEAERDAQGAEERCRRAEAAFDALKATMQTELARFHRGRREQMLSVAEEFCRSQLALAEELQKVWGGALGELDKARAALRENPDGHVDSITEALGDREASNGAHGTNGGGPGSPP